LCRHSNVSSHDAILPLRVYTYGVVHVHKCVVRVSNKSLWYYTYLLCIVYLMTLTLIKWMPITEGEKGLEAERAVFAV
jgi:hypothetical protein